MAIVITRLELSGGGFARCGETDPGRESSSPDDSDCVGSGRLVAGRCGRGGRDGPPDAVRLGAPLQ